MRHHNNNRKFGRETQQRKALLSGLMVSLIAHGKIETTEAKAKELRKHIEPLVTRAKNATVFNRRVISSKLMNNTPETKKLIDVVAPKYKDVKGGYTRIIKLPVRLSDSSKMAIIEFV